MIPSCHQVGIHLHTTFGRLNAPYSTYPPAQRDRQDAGVDTYLSNTTVEAYSGGELTVTVVDDTIFVNDAKVIIPNILLSNGVAHVIDRYVPSHF